MSKHSAPNAPWFLVGLAVAVVSTMAAPALACGGLFSDDVDTAVSADAQRVLAVWSDKNVSMWAQVTAAGDAGYAWVLPVPGDPEVELGDPAVLDALDDMTAPIFDVEIASESGGGCGSTKAATPGSATTDGVEWLGGGELGDLTYDVLASDQASKMVEWLEDNGYVVPEGAAETLQPYSDRKMRFVWAQLPAGAQPVPLVLTFRKPPDARLMVPLALSALSATETTPVVLWVLADKRYRVETYGAKDLDHVADDLVDDVLELGQASYVDYLDDATAAAGGRLFVTEFARDLREWTVPADVEALIDDETSFYLTRLYARIPAESLADAVMGPGSDSVEVSNEAIVLVPAGAAGLSLMILLALVGIRRRRSQCSCS